jgi:serine/threonine protein kinase
MWPAPPRGRPPGPDSGDGSPEPGPVSPDGLPGLGRLGDFHLVREVGRGGMGVVYEAEQLSLRRRRVALKVLPLVATMDAQRLQRFQNEAQTAACLHHGNIVPVYAVGCERGVHFYAMQYIEGQSLAAVIRCLRRQAGKEPPPPGPSALAHEPAFWADPQRTTDHAPAVPASPTT